MKTKFYAHFDWSLYLRSMSTGAQLGPHGEFVFTVSSNMAASFENVDKTITERASIYSIYSCELSYQVVNFVTLSHTSIICSRYCHQFSSSSFFNATPRVKSNLLGFWFVLDFGLF